MTRWRRGLALTALLVAPSCDLAIGLDGYTFSDPMGGAGGEGGVGGAAPECTMDEECALVSGDCFVPTCDQGACAEIPATSGTACDELGGDTCDATGGCRKSDGKGCEAAIECISNACVDGVCCQSACDGVCARCDAPSSLGVCAPDPVATVCGDGVCDGTASGLCHQGAHRFSGAWGDPMDQRAFGLAFDPNGAVWLGGYLEGNVDLGDGPATANQVDPFLMKLDATGAFQTALRWANAGYQAVNEVAVNSRGDVLAIGTYAGDADFGFGPLDNGGALSVFLLAIDSAGQGLWHQDFVETNVEQQGTHVAVVPGSDDVVAAGYFKGGLGTLVASTGRFDVFAMRFSSDGQLQWEKHWGSAAEDQRTDGLDVDAAGNVYLTGQLAGSIDFGTGALESTTPTLDAFVAKLDPAGEGLWSVKLESPEDVHATDVAVAPDGRVVVVGHFEDTLTVASTSITSAAPDERDVFLLTLAADGSLTALKRYGDAGGSQLAEAVAVDAHGNIALTGRFSSQLVIDGLLLQATSLTTRDIFAVLLAPDLTPLWGKAFGGSSLNDGGLGVAFSPSFDVGIVGGLRSTANFGGMSLTSQGEADLFVACFAP